jgi:hypothetical protein
MHFAHIVGLNAAKIKPQNPKLICQRGRLPPNVQIPKELLEIGGFIRIVIML